MGEWGLGNYKPRGEARRGRRAGKVELSVRAFWECVSSVSPIGLFQPLACDSNVKATRTYSCASGAGAL